MSASQLHALGLLRAGCGTLAGIGLILSVLPVAWRWLAQRARLRVCLTECAILLGVFLVAFALTSPYLLPLRVVKGLMAESVHVGFGHSFASESGVTTWLHVLASGDVLGRSIAALAAIGLAAQAWRWFRRRDRLSPRSVLWAWVALYIVYLFARVSMTEARYLFVVVPVLMILVAELAVGWVARLAQRRWRHVALAAAAGLAVLLVIAPAWTRAARYRSERLSRVGTSCAVQAGNWIAAHYPASMRIAHDAYAYIPPQFAATQWHWAWTQDDLARFEPDLIVVHQEMRRRFADPARADLYVHGAERYWATADYYRRLEEQRGFRLVRDLGDVQIYTSNSDAAAGRVSSTALAPE